MSPSFIFFANSSKVGSISSKPSGGLFVRVVLILGIIIHDQCRSKLVSIEKIFLNASRKVDDVKSGGSDAADRPINRLAFPLEIKAVIGKHVFAP